MKEIYIVMFEYGPADFNPQEEKYTSACEAFATKEGAEAGKDERIRFFCRANYGTRVSLGNDDYITYKNHNDREMLARYYIVPLPLVP